MTRRIFIMLMASSAMAQPAKNLETGEWTQPFPPFRIAGNLYYVGTYDLACYLIVTPAGNILINTGLAGSAAQIRANIAALGFHFSDTRLLLATHAHWDHVSAMAEVKRLTGARMAAMEADAALLESGGKTDFRWGEDSGAWFQPVQVDEKLQDGQKVGLGGMELTVHLHPGQLRIHRGRRWPGLSRADRQPAQHQPGREAVEQPQVPQHRVRLCPHFGGAERSAPGDFSGVARQPVRAASQISAGRCV
jgi:hypothetical protein